METTAGFCYSTPKRLPGNNYVAPAVTYTVICDLTVSARGYVIFHTFDYSQSAESLSGKVYQLSHLISSEKRRSRHFTDPFCSSYIRAV